MLETMLVTPLPWYRENTRSITTPPAHPKSSTSATWFCPNTAASDLDTSPRLSIDTSWLQLPRHYRLPKNFLLYRTELIFQEDQECMTSSRSYISDGIEGQEMTSDPYLSLLGIQKHRNGKSRKSRAREIQGPELNSWLNGRATVTVRGRGR